MKGLFIKDYYLLLQQKTFFFILVCFAICTCISGDDAVFALSFIMFIFSLLAGNTISYDEYNHGYTFLFTLPVTRKTYVKEKYILSVLTSLCGWGMGCIIILLSAFLYGTTDSLGSIFSFGGYLLPVLLLLQCIHLPVQLKFGAEKGRTVFFLLIGGTILAITLLLKLPALQNIDITYLLNATVVHPLLAMAVIPVIILVELVSFSFSCHIMKHKEF